MVERPRPASLSIYGLNCLDRTVALAVGYVDPKSTSRAWADQLGYLVTATFLSTSMEVGVDVRWPQPEVRWQPFLHFECARRSGKERRGRQLAVVPCEGLGCVRLWGVRRCQSTSALVVSLCPFSVVSCVNGCSGCGVSGLMQHCLPSSVVCNWRATRLAGSWTAQNDTVAAFLHLLVPFWPEVEGRIQLLMCPA